MISRTLKNWRADSRGNVAMIFAITATVLVPMVYFATQIRSIDNQRFTLQTAADNAALAVVQELSVIGGNADSLKSLTLSQINANLASNSAYLDEPKMIEAVILPAGSTDNPANEDVLQVTVQQLPIADYQTIFGYPEKKPIRVSSRAVRVGASSASNVCVLGLNQVQTATVLLDQNAILTANDCAVISNSSSSHGLEVRIESRLEASAIFSSGGAIEAQRSEFSPEPVLDYPALEDPLRNRQPPTFSGCDFHNFQTSRDEEVTLEPGVYCGGMNIFNDSKVTLEPGEYIIKDGQLAVQNSAELIGEGVGFYLEGNAAQIRFFHESVVRLSAPVDGPLAGILFFGEQERNNIVRHVFSSNNARQLVGTIYLPKGRLVIDSTQPVADESEYTAIIVNQLQLVGTPNLVLNADYDETEVPVPDGLILGQNAGSRLIR